MTALRVLGHGLELELGDQEVVRIGRLDPPDNDITLRMESVSRRHAVITRSELALEVTDLGSTNGISHRYRCCAGLIRRPRIRVHAGDRFAIGSVDLLALDDETRSALRSLEGFLGPRDSEEVDNALAAILCGHVMVVHGEPEALLALARMLHAHSSRRGYPFTHISQAPASDEAIAQLCARGAGGVAYLDVTTPFKIAPRLVSELLSREYAIWTIVGTIASTADDIQTLFGHALDEANLESLAICLLGFPPRDRSPASEQ